MERIGRGRGGEEVSKFAKLKLVAVPNLENNNLLLLSRTPLAVMHISHLECVMQKKISGEKISVKNIPQKLIGSEYIF